MKALQCRFAVAAGLTLILFLAAESLAQEPPVGSPAGKGAGPRLGLITRIEITLDSRADLDRLIEAGFDVASVDGNRILVFADGDELAALQAQGWSLRILEWPKPPSGPALKALGSYHNYTNMTAMLDGYVAAYPAICRKISIGKSVRGRDLWAMKLTSNPDLEQDKPEVKFVGAIHGVEPESAELCLYFIDHVLSGYANNDTRILKLINDIEIWVLPMINPDGRESNSRENASGYDLNRMFPSRAATLLQSRLYGAPLGTNGRPPEVRHIMTWTEAHNFSLAINFHTGALLACYPYGEDGLAACSKTVRPNVA